MHSPDDSWDDVIPAKVVEKVYKTSTHHDHNSPEGEPISDFMHNGWDGLNGVADPWDYVSDQWISGSVASNNTIDT